MGTLSYMSPESINGEEDSGYKVPLKSDVWSLGCILYSVVYGRSPFQDYKFVTFFPLNESSGRRRRRCERSRRKPSRSSIRHLKNHKLSMS